MLKNKRLLLIAGWCGEEEYLERNPSNRTKWSYLHGRRYNRDVDCAKVLQATGLTKQDFASVEEGIKRELVKLGRTIKE